MPNKNEGFAPAGAEDIPLSELTPVLSPDIVLPMIDEIANDLGLRGCKTTVKKGVPQNAGH